MEPWTDGSIPTILLDTTPFPLYWQLPDSVKEIR